MRAWIVVVCLSALLCRGPSAFAASAAPVAAEHGMVVTAQHHATRVGVEVLKAGGNAIDAAVAVGYALAVVYPAAGNLGGGGFMTVQFADGRKTFIDFRETAPLGASADMYLDDNGELVPGASTLGHRAVAVPGSVSGLEYARGKYGTQSRARLIDPAIRLAQRGFTLEQGDIDMLGEALEDLRRDPASAAIFLESNQPHEVNDVLIQRDLARTLRAVRARGVDGFYKGAVAAALVAANQQGGGLLTQQDLDRYTTRELTPLECEYRGYVVIAAPPPSSGGVALCEALNILEGFPLGKLGYGSAQAVHYQIEAMRRAFADRNNFLGDPAFVTNPTQRLISDEYAAQVRAVIPAERALRASEVGAGVNMREGVNTTHYSIVDRMGNAVAVTYTLNAWFGARVTAAGTGVLLNNEMDDFTAKVGAPNLYGLVQGEANRIEPGKRPLSSMSPTIVAREGKPVAVLGTPGGSRIITAVLLTLVNLIDYDMDVQEAVDAPRFHQQWLPEETNVEEHALSPDTRVILERMGHRFGPPQPANHVAAILIGAPALKAAPIGRNRFYGAIDPRRNTGLAAGY